MNSRIGQDTDLLAHLEDDLRTGAFPVIEGLVSTRLSVEVAAQFDIESGELLLAGREEQFLLSQGEVQALLDFLYTQLADR